ncbi:uncharacterized protein LOC125501689 [Athalia rosae]|uniref:uncharacterized protein LOC125501689 n=1 Tax=Athalia rosae TaxID=37344 RepID=UPI002033ED7E|nr:uncharacterized protein LOC125501689 [Athalia rosae]
MRKVSLEQKPRYISLPKHHDRVEIPRISPLHDSDTLTRDNWRNKETISHVNFSMSSDEMGENSVLNQCESPLMLRTGSMMPGITLDGEVFQLSKTEIFDAIIHILSCSALDNPNYLTIIKDSPNGTLQFILHFIEKKSCEQIYKERAVLLKCLYSSNMCSEKQKSNDVHMINLTGTLSTTWETCLDNEPSLYCAYECELCGSYITLLPVLTVDTNLILRKGFEALNEGLHFYHYLTKVKCQQEGCPEMCTVTAYPNFHICIYLDVRRNDRSHTKIQCKLQNFPKTLELKSLPGQYRLQGIVSESSDRTVAYCLRAEDHWELYDGYSMIVETFDSSGVINPCGAIYIRT